MSVCMYACMYVGMYVCVCARARLCMNVGMSVYYVSCKTALYVHPLLWCIVNILDLSELSVRVRESE